MEEPTLDGLKKMYPWWLSTRQVEGPVTSSENVRMYDTVSLFEGRNTQV
jgi:hypothetical protein